jgi:hypothetical protein
MTAIDDMLHVLEGERYVSQKYEIGSCEPFGGATWSEGWREPSETTVGNVIRGTI